MTYRCGECGSYEVFAGQRYCSAVCERHHEATLRYDRQCRMFPGAMAWVRAYTSHEKGCCPESARLDIADDAAYQTRKAGR